VFAVKVEVLKELLKDEEWTRKLDACKTVSDAQRVVMEFCKAKGYKTKEA